VAMLQINGERHTGYALLMLMLMLMLLLHEKVASDAAGRWTGVMECNCNCGVGAGPSAAACDSLT
jgi:hypothetical protein